MYKYLATLQLQNWLSQGTEYNKSQSLGKEDKDKCTMLRFPSAYIVYCKSDNQ